MWFVVDRGGTLCIACGGYKLIHINPHETGVNLQHCFVVLYIYILLCGNSCTWAHDVREEGMRRAHCIVFMITYVLCSSCFCKI